MKALSLTTMIAIFLLLCTNGIQAQTMQTKLNQIELMKQQLGSWKCDVAKDTTAFCDEISYGTGFEIIFKVVTKGKIIWEQKNFTGYDKSIDKYIDAAMVKGEDIVLCAIWFISNNKYEVVPYKDISNPENASWKVEGEFKSPDEYVETYLENGKTVWTETYTRVK